jgi:hypothetical protein
MKNDLTDLIETYAAARISGNSRLQQYATAQLMEFLNGIEINPATPPEDEGA